MTGVVASPRRVHESENESARVRTRALEMRESERWFKVSTRRGRDRFNSTNTMLIFQNTDVNIILLTSVFGTKRC